MPLLLHRLDHMILPTTEFSAPFWCLGQRKRWCYLATQSVPLVRFGSTVFSWKVRCWLKIHDRSRYGRLFFSFWILKNLFFKILLCSGVSSYYIFNIVNWLQYRKKALYIYEIRSTLYNIERSTLFCRDNQFYRTCLNASMQFCETILLNHIIFSLKHPDI